MSELSYNSTLLTRYWLDDLPPVEQDQLEEDYFADNDLFIELLDAKDQLVSDYLSGQLSPDDRERFERRFLTRPGCQIEVELAGFLQPSLMRRSLTRQPALSDRAGGWLQAIFDALRARQPLAGFAMAALLMMFAAGVWSVIRFSSDKGQAGLSQTGAPVPAGPAIVSLTLKPVRFRAAGGDPKAVVGPETQLIELRLEVGAESYQSYRASLQMEGSGNAEVLTDSSLKAEMGADGKRIVIWKAPASGLFGDYQVKLSGVGADGSLNNIGAYYFKVRNQ
jgi:hypothetical protein